MASGDSLCYFTPAMSEPPSSAYATFDTRNGVLVLDFDSGIDESVEFPGFMPRHYSDSPTGVTVTIGWMATTATSGNCIWDVAFKSITTDVDLISKSFAAVNSVTAAPASASGEVLYSTITFTDGADMDSVAKGEYFRLFVGRDGANGSDTMAGDAELVFIEIKET